MVLYVEKEQIWVKIASTGGKVNSQNEHFKKSPKYSHSTIQGQKWCITRCKLRVSRECEGLKVNTGFSIAVSLAQCCLTLRWMWMVLDPEARRRVFVAVLTGPASFQLLCRDMLETGKKTLLWKNKQLLVAALVLEKQVSWVTMNPVTKVQRKFFLKLNHFRIVFMIIIHMIMLSILMSWFWYALSWDLSALNPNAVFPFRKPEIASIQCSEAPGFCQVFKMIVKFQSLASSGQHITHLAFLRGLV